MLLLDWLADFLVRPASPPSCLTIFLGYHSLLGYNSRFSHLFTARILVKLSGSYVILFACLPLSSLFVRYAHLTVMSLCPASEDFYGSGTSLCNHRPFALEPTAPFYAIQLLTGEPSASFRSLKISLFSLGLSHWKRFISVCTARSA